MFIIFTVFIISIILNLIFFILDIYPLFHHWKFKRFIKKQIDNDKYIELIIKRSILMLKSKRGYFFNRIESNNLIERLKSLIRHNNFTSFSIYNYHKAYLIVGLYTLLSKLEDKRAQEVKMIFDKNLDNEGCPKFTIDKIDQVVFGLMAIELFRNTADCKYHKCSDILFEYLQNNINKDGIIQYRKGPVQLVDTIGMIIPFLVSYGITFNNKEALSLAYINLNEYIKFGLDQTTRLPYHGYNINSKIKLGPTNWNRGIGWYILGLYYTVQYTNKDNNPYYYNHLKEFVTLRTLLVNECTNELWTQYLGQRGLTDTSASLLFLYSNNEEYDINFNQHLDYLKSLTKTNGMIDFTSGETIAINRYSHSFSHSDLSQGILLHYISKNLKV